MRDALEQLQTTFGFSGFRPHQEEIIRAVIGNRDVFAALPTGGGKSLCYQLPALLRDGLTVVVSPLIALMHDQVEGARQYGVPAACVNSSLDAQTVSAVYRDVRSGKIRLLYASPERLAVDSFRSALHDWGVSLFAIDEAHCISEWGHEFRPDYRHLASLRADYPGTPIAAFTATATRRVQTDIVETLGLSDPFVVRGDFDRREIFYRVQRKEKVADQILSFVRDHRDQPGIVYRSTRKAVDQCAAYLNHRGIPAAPYHAGLSDTERRTNQDLFVRDEVQVIVATIAFGMGIDKSNVRWVVHGELPRSLEAYYQETGRAGRDGVAAEACLFYGAQDIAGIRYHIDRLQSEQERERATIQLREMLRFADSGQCRRIGLLAHFDQEHRGDCGGCDVCSGDVERTDRTTEAQMAMSAVVRTGQRFGAHHIADVVTGTLTERIERLGHNRLPTFGVSSVHPRGFWLDLIGDLEGAGLLRRDGPKSGLTVTPAGKLVLFGKERFMAIDRAPRGDGSGVASAGPARRAPTADGDDPEPMPLRPSQVALFERLRELRRDLARAQSVPPYVIFSDRTLIAMARIRPTTRAALLRVHGVGDVKAERYGDAFLETIQGFLSQTDAGVSVADDDGS